LNTRDDKQQEWVAPVVEQYEAGLEVTAYAWSEDPSADRRDASR
jgi:hypothetical protein